MRPVRAFRFGAAATAAAAAAGGSSLLSLPHHRAKSEEAGRSQWLWSIDGIELRRSESGTVTYLEADSGDVLPDRPAAVPPEAYANQWRAATQLPDAGGKCKAQRHLLLVRHGQYVSSAKRDSSRVLTPLGVEQARLCGERLRAIQDSQEGPYARCNTLTLTSSTLTRAVQTADLIAPSLPQAARKALPLLNEGRPCLPEPPPSRPEHFDNRHHEAERIEAAFRRLCMPPTKGESWEVVVCHANVIRYVICRALQLPPEAWLRLAIPHGSISHLVIRSNGDVSLKAFGDAGFVPPAKVSYS